MHSPSWRERRERRERLMRKESRPLVLGWALPSNCEWSSPNACTSHRLSELNYGPGKDNQRDARRICFIMGSGHKHDRTMVHWCFFFLSLILSLAGSHRTEGVGIALPVLVGLPLTGDTDRLVFWIRTAPNIPYGQDFFFFAWKLLLSIWLWSCSC